MVKYTSHSDNVGLYGFPDSLNITYKAVAYLRVVTADYGNFVMSKSRHSPIRNKTMTTPTLELQVAVLA